MDAPFEKERLISLSPDLFPQSLKPLDGSSGILKRFSSLLPLFSSDVIKSLFWIHIILPSPKMSSSNNPGGHSQMNPSGPPWTQIAPRPQELRSHGSISSSIDAISFNDCVAVVFVVAVAVVVVVVVVVIVDVVVGVVVDNFFLC